MWDNRNACFMHETCYHCDADAWLLSEFCCQHKVMLCRHCAQTSDRCVMCTNPQTTPHPCFDCGADAWLVSEFCHDQRVMLCTDCAEFSQRCRLCPPVPKALHAVSILCLETRPSIVPQGNFMEAELTTQYSDEEADIFDAFEDDASSEGSFGVSSGVSSYGEADIFDTFEDDSSSDGALDTFSVLRSNGEADIFDTFEDGSNSNGALNTSSGVNWIGEADIVDSLNYESSVDGTFGPCHSVRSNREADIVVDNFEDQAIPKGPLNTSSGVSSSLEASVIGSFEDVSSPERLLGTSIGMSSHGDTHMFDTFEHQSSNCSLETVSNSNGAINTLNGVHDRTGCSEAYQPRCFLPETYLFKLGFGFERVDKLRSGDKVYGPGGPAEVDRIIFCGREARQVITLTFGGVPSPFTITADHRMVVYNRNRNRVAKPVCELQVNDRLLSDMSDLEVVSSNPHNGW